MLLSEFVTKVADGKIFTVTFVKRTNGEVRVMNCRTGVKAHLTGGTLGYKPEMHNLLSVFDLQKQGYRMVNLEDLISLKLAGKVYIWDKKTNRFVEQED